MHPHDTTDTLDEAAPDVGARRVTACTFLAALVLVLIGVCSAVALADWKPALYGYAAAQLLIVAVFAGAALRGGQR